MTDVSVFVSKEDRWLFVGIGAFNVKSETVSFPYSEILYDGLFDNLGLTYQLWSSINDKKEGEKLGQFIGFSMTYPVLGAFNYEDSLLKLHLI